MMLLGIKVLISILLLMMILQFWFLQFLRKWIILYHIISLFHLFYVPNHFYLFLSLFSFTLSSMFLLLFSCSFLSHLFPLLLSFSFFPSFFSSHLIFFLFIYFFIFFYFPSSFFFSTTFLLFFSSLFFSIKAMWLMSTMDRRLPRIRFILGLLWAFWWERERDLVSLWDRETKREERKRKIEREREGREV